MADEHAGMEDCIDEVFKLLDRTVSIDALSSLSNAMRFELPSRPLSQTVIAFDANVFLRLSSNPRCEDIVDYLRTSFEGKIVLPGQVIQEFWNNQFLAISTLSTSIQNKFRELRGLISTIDGSFDAYAERFEQFIQEFNSDFGYVFDEKTTRKTRLFVDLLRDVATVPFIDRTRLSVTAKARKRSKTPPGFKDDLDGDFYVWADLLLGLVLLAKSGFEFKRVILVTLDKKIDWSREGVPHPILSAEIAKICGAEFETITVETLARRLLD